MKCEALSVGANVVIPCEWTRGGTVDGRVVSVCDDVACVAVRHEVAGNEFCHEMFWVPLGDVREAAETATISG